MRWMVTAILKMGQRLGWGSPTETTPLDGDEGGGVVRNTAWPGMRVFCSPVQSWMGEKREGQTRVHGDMCNGAWHGKMAWCKWIE